MPLALAACLTELPAAGGEVQLLPPGPFRAVDGRPTDAPHWVLPPERAAALRAEVAARRTPRVIDYEHQTLHAEHNGQPAPAAGWFHQVASRDGGLYALAVEWTERAKALIAAREYRYISPVFTYEPGSGEIVDVLHAALTNTPALDGLAAVSARYQSLHREITMTLSPALRAALALPDDADEAAALAAIAALQTPALAPEADAVAAARAAAPDPARYAPVAALTAAQDALNAARSELAALKAAQIEGELEALVQAALADGRLLPALLDWARALGRQDLAALRVYLDHAHPVAALTGMQTQGRTPPPGATTLTRAAFDALPPAERRAHFARGGLVID